MVCCDRGYGRPSWRPRVSPPATYCLSTPRVRVPAVARLHAHLHGLVTTIHEMSGLGPKANVIWCDSKYFRCSGICSDGREKHGSGQGKLLHKGAYSPLTRRLAQSEFNLFDLQPPLDFPSQGGESMVIDVHPSEFRKNPHF